MAVERYAGEWTREILGLPELPESERRYFHPCLKPAPPPVPDEPQRKCCDRGPPYCAGCPELLMD